MSQTFSGTQSAGNGNYPNNTGTALSPDVLTFRDFSYAGTATIDNPTYGYTAFQNYASAFNATITLNGGSVSFRNHSTAASASLSSFDPNSGISFFNNSSAGNADISLAVAGTFLDFEDFSDGGDATITSVPQTFVYLNRTAGPNGDGAVGIGQINGGANFYLGSNNLVLNGGVSDVSGHIIASPPPGQTAAGGLTLQNGTQLTVTGSLDYIGSTTIESGSSLRFGDGTATGGTTGSGSFTNDGTMVFDEGGNYSFGLDVSGAGSIQQAGLGVLALSGHITNALDVSSGTLELASSAAYDYGASPINFVGTGSGQTASVVFDQPTNGATVNGFDRGDTIDVRNIGTAVDAKYLNNSLVFQDAGGNTLSSIQLSGDFRTDTFVFSHDANGGAQVTLEEIPHHVITDLNSAKDELVYLLYQAAFDRIPDESGLRHFANLVDNRHYSINHVASDFVRSPEFKQDYGHPSNAQFVTELYNNVLERSPDAGGFAGYVRALNHHAQTRAQVLTTFAESPENHQLTAPRTTGGFWVT